MFYAFVTTANFEDDTHIIPNGSEIDTSHSQTPREPRPCLLTPDDLKLAHSLQGKLLEAFSPSLFQAPPASHMECTDAIADTWLKVVIPAAMASASPVNAGPEDEESKLSRELDLGRPLESLRALESLDWESRGVCKECSSTRRSECRSEREEIWAKIEQWTRSQFKA